MALMNISEQTIRNSLRVELIDQLSRGTIILDRRRLNQTATAIANAVAKEITPYLSNLADEIQKVSAAASSGGGKFS